MKVKSESEVAQSCLTLSDPLDCSPPGSSVLGIFQARVLEWGLLETKAFFYKQERGALERLLYWGEPHRLLLIFNVPFSLIVLCPIL